MTVTGGDDCVTFTLRPADMQIVTDIRKLKNPDAMADIHRFLAAIPQMWLSNSKDT